MRRAQKRLRRGYLRRPSRSDWPDVRSKRRSNRVAPLGPIFWALVIVLAAATWYFYTHQGTRNGETVAIYFTKQDGKTLGDVRVSMRPRISGESEVEHLHNTALYAAVQAVAGPPNDIPAIRFPPGTSVRSVTVQGTTAIVDLSKGVERQAGGTFGENGEFKALVFTLTGIRGINAVQILVDGNRLEALPGGHLELDEPLHRTDF